MELWQLDIMGSVFLADGTELKLVSGLDDHSRYCVIAHLVTRATGPTPSGMTVTLPSPNTGSPRGRPPRWSANQRVVLVIMLEALSWTEVSDTFAFVTSHGRGISDN